MYLTYIESIKAAKSAWEYAQLTLKRLGAAKDKEEKKAEMLQGVHYAAACANIETLRIQYAVMVDRVNELWAIYRETIEGYKHE